MGREMLPMALASQLLSMRLRLDSTLLRASNSQLMTCLTSTSRLRVPTALELTCPLRPLARLVKSTTTSRSADLSRQQSEHNDAHLMDSNPYLNQTQQFALPIKHNEYDTE